MPLKESHCEDLVAAVKDGELWNLPYTLIPKPSDVKKEIRHRLELQAKGLMLPFAVIHNPTQKIVGMTSYCQIDISNKRLDIGFTWYAKKYQKTALNTECKLLLLTHAFEVLECIAVGFRVDVLNMSSRTAVERLGAKFEGIVRHYGVMPDGRIRDMCFYSILPSEWIEIKAHLESFLKK